MAGGGDKGARGVVYVAGGRDGSMVYLAGGGGGGDKAAEEKQ